jgi:uncharacterized DUF497 family protein
LTTAWDGVMLAKIPRISTAVALPCYWQYDSNMEEIDFSWDERKNRENRRKHGVAFEEASTAFADENARLKHDPDHSEDEDRFILLGFSAKLRLLVVTHIYRQDGKQIRIVSARKATPNERKQYGQFL